MPPEAPGAPAHPRLAAWDGLLRCPACAGALHLRGRTLSCAAGHGTDLSRQGTAHLMTGASPASADTAAMLDARTRVLGSGLFAPVTAALVEAVAGARRVLDVGGGPGHHAAALAAADPARLVLLSDVSGVAARRAARVHERVAAVVADTWQALPVVDGTVDAVTCVFAPRSPAEFARVLGAEGRVVVAHPEPDHLAELRAAGGLLGVGEDKAERLAAAMAEASFAPAGETVVRSRVRPGAELARDLVAMGPNAFHDATLADDAVPASLSLAVRVVTWRRR